jgi:hypothetical protein
VTYRISLDRAYAIRSEMTAFIEDQFHVGNVRMPQTELVAEMLRRHPDVSRDSMDHFATRVAEHWGLPGLDYGEGYRSKRSPIRLWYPVERDGELQRVAFHDLTAAELAAMIEALRRQNEVAFSRLVFLHH